MVTQGPPDRSEEIALERICIALAISFFALLALVFIL